MLFKFQNAMNIKIIRFLLMQIRFVLGCTLDLSDIDLLDLDLSDAHLNLFDADIDSFLLNIFVSLQDFLKTPWRHLLKTSLRYVLKTSWRNILKTSWRRLPLNNLLFSKTSRRRLQRCLEDVLKTSQRRLRMMFWRLSGRREIVKLKMPLRRPGDQQMFAG